MPTSKGKPRADSFSALIKQALDAGFEHLAYALLVIAGGVAGLAWTPDKPEVPYVIARWALASLIVAGAVRIVIDMVERALARWFGRGAQSV